MAKKTTSRGRPADPSKIPIWCRIDKKAIGAIDQIARTMDPRPSRAQLIDLAVREFVERRNVK
jgi:hypothetical protein